MNSVVSKNFAICKEPPSLTLISLSECFPWSIVYDRNQCTRCNKMRWCLISHVSLQGSGRADMSKCDVIQRSIHCDIRFLILLHFMSLHISFMSLPILFYTSPILYLWTWAVFQLEKACVHEFLNVFHGPEVCKCQASMAVPVSWRQGAGSVVKGTIIWIVVDLGQNQQADGRTVLQPSFVVESWPLSELSLLL